MSPTTHVSGTVTGDMSNSDSPTLASLSAASASPTCPVNGTPRTGSGGTEPRSATCAPPGATSPGTPPSRSSTARLSSSVAASPASRTTRSGSASMTSASASASASPTPKRACRAREPPLPSVRPPRHSTLHRRRPSPPPGAPEARPAGGTTAAPPTGPAPAPPRPPTLLPFASAADLPLLFLPLHSTHWVRYRLACRCRTVFERPP